MSQINAGFQSYTGPESNKAIVRRWMAEVWEQGRVQTIFDLFAEDGVFYGFSGPTDRRIGPKDFAEQYQQFCSAFDHYKIDVESIVSEGDTVAARLVMKMQHTGDGLGFAATNRNVSLYGAAFAQIKNGKIVTAWNYFDINPVIDELQA